MKESDHSALTERIGLDNRFRLAVSLAAFVLAAVLHSVNILTDLRPLAWLVVAYNIPYLFIWALRRWISWLRPVVYWLSMLDFAAITLALKFTGSLNSPFFYLYPIPFLIHAFQFDLALIAFDGFLSLVCFGALIWIQHAGAPIRQVGIALGQLIFLCILVVAALFTAH